MLTSWSTTQPRKVDLLVNYETTRCRFSVMLTSWSTMKQRDVVFPEEKKDGAQQTPPTLILH